MVVLVPVERKDDLCINESRDTKRKTILGVYHYQRFNLRYDATTTDHITGGEAETYLRCFRR